eukprot:1137394-Pelagomonas_calceolata.AAC.1
MISAHRWVHRFPLFHCNEIHVFYVNVAVLCTAERQIFALCWCVTRSRTSTLYSCALSLGISGEQPCLWESLVHSLLGSSPGEMSKQWMQLARFALTNCHTDCMQ